MKLRNSSKIQVNSEGALLEGAIWALPNLKEKVLPVTGAAAQPHDFGGGHPRFWARTPITRSILLEKPFTKKTFVTCF